MSANDEGLEVTAEGRVQEMCSFLKDIQKQRELVEGLRKDHEKIDSAHGTAECKLHNMENQLAKIIRAQLPRVAKEIKENIS